MIPDSLLSARSARDIPSTRSREAYEAIREQIVTLVLAPASFLDEARLCAQLGLGRTPVREALIRLSFEDLVVILPRRGTMVADLNPSDLRKLYELYLELEVLAVRLAAGRAGAGDIARLRAWADLARRRSPELDDAALLDLDEQAHRLISAAAGNSFLGEALDRLAGHLRRLCYWHAARQRLRTLPGAVDLLVDVAEQIALRQTAAAAKGMTRHITIFRNELLGRDAVL